MLNCVGGARMLCDEFLVLPPNAGLQILLCPSNLSPRLGKSGSNFSPKLECKSPMSLVSSGRIFSLNHVLLLQVCISCHGRSIEAETVNSTPSLKTNGVLNCVSFPIESKLIGRWFDGVDQAAGAAVLVSCSNNSHTVSIPPGV